MPFVIATDEAGYGPKLGPLVIIATAWTFADQTGATTTFEEDVAAAMQARLSPPGAAKLGKSTDLLIGDSKQIFKRSAASGLDGLERPIAAFFPDLNWPKAPDNLESLLALLAENDLPKLKERPWFADLDLPFPLSKMVAPVATECRSQCALTAIGGRVIDAKRFNVLCDQLGNKATLLSEATVELVHDLYQASDQDHCVVYSDRHGGRQRYAGLLQQQFPDLLCKVISETPACSRYELVSSSKRIEWRFSVRGDSFAPVSYSSMVAKYLRERMMERFNHYWAQKHPGPLKPTAGYPNDANRYCEAIAATAKKLGIAEGDYIRKR